MCSTGVLKKRCGDVGAQTNSSGAVGSLLFLVNQTVWESLETPSSRIIEQSGSRGKPLSEHFPSSHETTVVATTRSVQPKLSFSGLLQPSSGVQPAIEGTIDYATQRATERPTTAF